MEFYFFQAYQKACRALQGIVGNDTTSRNKSGLQAIASAAAAGLATASVTDIADDILKFPTLPEIPAVRKCETLPRNIAQNLDSNNLPMIILLDLMFSSANSWDVCHKLMEVIKPHIKNKKQTSDSSLHPSESQNSVTVSKQRVSKIRTFQDFAVQMQSVLHLGAEDEIPSKEQMMLSKTFQKSIQHYLCHGTSSIIASKNREYVTLCQNLSKHVAKVNEALSHTKPRSHTTPESPLGSRRSASPVSRSPQDKLAIHHCMKVLVNFLEKEVPASGILSLINR